MQKSWRTPCCLLALFALPCSLGAQSKTRRDVHVSAREFVEGFYRWYVPTALGDNASRDIALKLKVSDFSPELRRLLREDSAAQAKCNEIVGIDFDPFLGTQDPADHYQVGEIRREGPSYQAAIFRSEDGKPSEKPDVIAEFSEREGGWCFVNFYYLNGTNLLKILRSHRTKCGLPSGEK